MFNRGEIFTTRRGSSSAAAGLFFIYQPGLFSSARLDSPLTLSTFLILSPPRLSLAQNRAREEPRETIREAVDVVVNVTALKKAGSGKAM